MILKEGKIVTKEALLSDHTVVAGCTMLRRLIGTGFVVPYVRGLEGTAFGDKPDNCSIW
jgi:hypothetical protein